MNAILHWQINHWADFLPFCLYSTHLFLLLLFTSFFFHRVMKWQKKWLTARICLLVPSHTHTITHTSSGSHKNSNSSFMFHVRSAQWYRLESPISMTTGLRIRVKTCHSKAIVRAPWFRSALNSEGKEQRTGVEREGFGSAGRIKWEDQFTPTSLLIVSHCG